MMYIEMYFRGGGAAGELCSVEDRVTDRLRLNLGLDSSRRIQCTLSEGG